MGMVVCNTFFKNEDSKLITYQSGDKRSMIDYLMVRKTDRCLVKDVKVISSEECIPQYRMVIGRLVLPMKPQKKEVYVAVMTAQESKLQEFTADLQSESGKKNCFRIAKQMAREGRDVISVCCMKNDAGNVVSDADGMKNIWRTYMEKLLNVENDWDGELDCPEMMGPHCLISDLWI